MTDSEEKEGQGPKLMGSILGNILQTKKAEQGEKIIDAPERNITVEEPWSEKVMGTKIPQNGENDVKDDYIVIDNASHPLDEGDSEPVFTEMENQPLDFDNEESETMNQSDNEKSDNYSLQSGNDDSNLQQTTQKKGEGASNSENKTRGDIDHDRWEEICDLPHIRKLPRFEGDKMVYVSAEAYATIVLYSTRYANDGIPRNRWNEIYGILIGKVSDGIIFVNRAEPMTVGHSVDVQLGPEHYVFISQIQDDLEKDGKGEYMVGWFHSHPGLTLFYSYTDLMNHLNFQTVNPDFVGIVFDPIYIKEKPGHPGIVMYRLNDTMMDVESAEFENNYHEMRYRIIGLNLPFLSHTLLRASNNYGKGLPLQLSYGEKLNPQSVPIKTIKAQDTDTPKTVAPQAQQQAAQDKSATGGQKAISSIQSVPAKSSSKITIKRADNVSQISKIESAKGKEDFEKEILSIKDLQERGLKYFLEAKKLFYLKNFDSSLALFKQAFNSFKEYGEKATQVYLKSVNEAFELFFKEDIFTVAHELAELLVSLAEEFGSMFYLGVGQQFLGELKIKKGKLEEGIDYLDQATVVFAKLPDYAGAGYANYLIGETYFKNSEWDHSALYYVEAISNFNQIKGHSDFYQQRKDVWATLSNIKKMISNIQTKLGELKPKITDQRVLDKIEFAMKN